MLIFLIFALNHNVWFFIFVKFLSFFKVTHRGDDIFLVYVTRPFERGTPVIINSV